MIKGADLKKEWNLFILSESESAYYDLYTHYYHYLSFLGFKRGVGTGKVKDCINDLFLYVWENREKLANVKDHHSYIITAFLRKLFRKEPFSEAYSVEVFGLPDYISIPSVESLYIKQNIQDDVAKILKTYIEQLPCKQRQLIYQKFYLGLSYKEISNINNISVNTVYNTIYKAVDKLKILIPREHLNMFSLAISALSLFFLFFFLNQ